jgi:hypothetical protein
VAELCGPKRRESFFITGEQLGGRIYLLNGESKLIAMEESAYDSESLFQKVLADHPDLLAGEQINAEEPTFEKSHSAALPAAFSSSIVHANRRPLKKCEVFRS